MKRTELFSLPLAAFAKATAAGQQHPGGSPNPLLLLRCRNAARLALGLGLGQEPEARLTPREINADIQQSIGTSARAGKFHDRDDAIGLPGDQGHRQSSGMIWGDIDA